MRTSSGLILGKAECGNLNQCISYGSVGSGRNPIIHTDRIAHINGLLGGALHRDGHVLARLWRIWRDSDRLNLHCIRGRACVCLWRKKRAGAEGGSDTDRSPCTTNSRICGRRPEDGQRPGHRAVRPGLLARPRPRGEHRGGRKLTVRRPGLALAVVAVVVPHDERLRVHRILHRAAKAVSGQAHGRRVKQGCVESTSFLGSPRFNELFFSN